MHGEGVSAARSSGGALRHSATAELLREVFPESDIGDAHYLEWLYEASPFGRVVEANHDDPGGRAAHYAVVPLELADQDGQTLRGALSLNTGVHQRARRRGLFTKLAEETYVKAQAEGIGAVVGVSNDSSTHGMVNSLGFTLLGPLPVTIVPPLPMRGGRVRSREVTPALLESDEMESLERLLKPPTGALARRWTVDSLRWRLAAPGRRYALHIGDEACAISTAARRQGLRFAVICAVFAPSPLSARSFLRLVTHARRHERAVAATYIGVNRHLSIIGLPVPKPLRESPLNLIYRNLDEPGCDPPAIARWEALDFDAF